MSGNVTLKVFWEKRAKIGAYAPFEGESKSTIKMHEIEGIGYDRNGLGM